MGTLIIFGFTILIIKLIFMSKSIGSHVELDIWKSSISLVKEIYEISRNFPSTENYILSNQMKRSAISIPSNIAEGSARRSTKEYIHFLYISLSSLSELETQLFLALELGFIKEIDVIESKIIVLRRKIKATINGLNKKLSCQ